MSNNKQYAPYNMYAPDGTVAQLSYARGATELGSTSVAATNGRIAVLMAHNPRTSKLAKMSENKVTKIGEGGLFTFSGITNDGLAMIRYLNSKVLEENITKAREIHPIYVFDDLVYHMAYKAISDERLCGAAGILVSEFEGELRITELEPNSKAIDVHGTAIGSRNQSCKTILSTALSRVKSMNEKQMIELCLNAMKNAHPEENELKKDEIECYLMRVGEKTMRISEF